MATNQIKMHDLDKIIYRAKQGNNWKGIVYDDGTWQILVNIMACTIDFIVRVQYKNGKFGMDRVVIKPNNLNDYTINSYTGQLKLPVAIQSKITSIFKHFTDSVYFVKNKSKNVFDTTYVDSDSDGYTISLKTCIDILVPDPYGNEIEEAMFTPTDYASLLGGWNIIQDKKGDTYLYVGSFSQFRFWRPRPAGNTTKTGLPGESDKYIINVNYDRKFIYIPIISPETLKLFRKSFSYGMIKNIEQQVRELNIKYIKDIARDKEIKIVKGFRIESSDYLTDRFDLDYKGGIYDGRLDKNILGWKWKYDLDKNGCDDIDVMEEERPIHW